MKTSVKDMDHPAFNEELKPNLDKSDHENNYICVEKRH